MKFYDHGGSPSSDNEVLDFSVNLNPLGMPHVVRQAIIESANSAEQYPNPKCKELTNAISDYEDLPSEQIICGNGAADLIIRLCLFLKPPKALLTAPTFSEYEKAVSIVGGKVEYCYLTESQNFSVTSDILSQINDDSDILFICNPNNPTGQLTSFELLSQISKKCVATGTFLVVDESFLSFTEGKSMKALFTENKNIAVIKSFTKMFSMAGVRLGYLICPNEKVVCGVEFCAQAWSVSSIAQASGIAALQIPNHIKKTRALVKKERIFLSEQLISIGIKVYPSVTNFLLCCSDKPVTETLCGYGIYVRSCENFVGLDSSYFRIAVRNHDDNRKLIMKIAEVLNG